MRRTRGAYRLYALLCVLLPGGCDDVWDQDEDKASPSPPPATTEMPKMPGMRCTALAGDLRQSSAASTGAFCFGVASGLSDALVCGVEAAGVVCRDDVVGVAYVVGGSGAVVNAVTGAKAGTVSRVNASAFEVTTAAVQGICTVTSTNGLSLAKFCAYEG